MSRTWSLIAGAKESFKTTGRQSRPVVQQSEQDTMPNAGMRRQSHASFKLFSIAMWCRIRQIAANRKHVLATSVQPNMVATTQPPDIQRLVVAVMMGINLAAAAHLTALLVQGP